ncbi:MAG: type II toxin-antitoxin system RelE/ParE family toxin [Flavobacteriales bacterium]|nr:type II toxin-antitoxin system RelE/ParE family toxin [Flavobacteriales bacterium]
MYLSKTAEEKLTILLEFLLTEWNQKVRNDFLNKLKAKINQISAQPESCPQSEEVKGLFKCVVQNKTHYTIK